MNRPEPVDPIEVDSADDLGVAQLLAVARGARVRLTPGLLGRVETSREATVEALAAGEAVYGVTTGMGLQSDVAVAAADDPSQQSDLMLARAVGTPPWLTREEVRTVVAARVRTLLGAEVGISPALLCALVDLLEGDLHPAVPAAGNGAAGEIIPLAHLGGFLTGSGEGLDEQGRRTDSGSLLERAGLAPYRFAAKEGVAFLQGVPTAAALAVLRGHEAHTLAGQALVAASGSVAAVRAPRDPFHPALAGDDASYGEVLRVLRDLAGPESHPRLLQAPVSFRVAGQAITYLLRTLDGLDAAVRRSLASVTTSPALFEGRFLGTSGFDGFELAASLDATRTAVLHLAEIGTARLHRLLDVRVTGLTAQLSAQPGRQAGLVVLHKRAVGLLHTARRQASPASIGASETSLGQEDVQSFALDAAQALGEACRTLREVTACELLALHQARHLEPPCPTGSPSLSRLLTEASTGLSESTADRPPGRDVERVAQVLASGWADGVLPPRDGSGGAAAGGGR